MKISDSKLEHLHAALMKQFKEVLGQKGRSNLSMKYSKNPKDVPADSALTCELVYSNEGGFVDRALDGMKSGGGKAPKEALSILWEHP